MKMKLRGYQREAVDAIYDYFSEHQGNPLVVCPTGSGKSLIQAAFIQEAVEIWPHTRILGLTHVKELIAQNLKAIHNYFPYAKTGIYCSGLGKKETDKQITLASIQSISGKLHLFEKFDLILIDECHLVPKAGDGQYITLIELAKAANPALKVIGLSATPFRLKGGLLHKGKGRIFTDIAYDIPIHRLVDEGYLCPLRSKVSKQEVNPSSIRKTGGEYVMSDAEKEFGAKQFVANAVSDITILARSRKKILVFCCTKKHAEDVAKCFGPDATFLHSGLSKTERDWRISAFKAGRVSVLTNVNVLTTGFDAPDIDCIVFLRPTKSSSLYVQMSGRGMRIAQGKKDCLILDYAGNIREHGPIACVSPHSEGKDGKPAEERIKIVICPHCGEVHYYERERPELCEDCGKALPELVERTVKHKERADTDVDIMERPKEEEVRWYSITNVSYAIHKKAGKPDSLRVDYKTSGIIPKVYSEYICLKHGGYATLRAEKWWMHRYPSARVPETIPEALQQSRLLIKPTHIGVKKEGSWDRIVGYKWDNLEQLLRESITVREETG